MTTGRMRIACWIPKATNTPSQYVIFTAFPLQQWLRGRISMLCHRTLPVVFKTATNLRIKKKKVNVSSSHVTVIITSGISRSLYRKISYSGLLYTVPARIAGPWARKDDQLTNKISITMHNHNEHFKTNDKYRKHLWDFP